MTAADIPWNIWARSPLTPPRRSHRQGRLERLVSAVLTHGYGQRRASVGPRSPEEARPVRSRAAPEPAVPCGLRVVELEGGRGGPRAGDLRARTAQAALPAPRRRARVSDACSAQPLERAAPIGRPAPLPARAAGGPRMGRGRARGSRRQPARG